MVVNKIFCLFSRNTYSLLVGLAKYVGHWIGICSVVVVELTIAKEQ